MVTICNKLLNGTITMPVVRTTGMVSTGDFISALQLIKATGDTVGGLLYKTDFINGKAITTLYYGVTVQRVPDDVFGEAVCLNFAEGVEFLNVSHIFGVLVTLY